VGRNSLTLELFNSPLTICVRKDIILFGKRFVCLVAAALATSAAGTTASAMAGTLNGAGSTLIAPLESQWAGAWGPQTGNSVFYGAVGSGTGLKDIAANSVDFGASDAPLSASTTSCGQCVQLPWGLTATAVAFHINGLRKLNLSGPVLARIFLGQITNWNDPQITALNKGTALPNLAITPVHRSDSSGDTYVFTDFLTRVSSQWRGAVGTGTLVGFPTTNAGKGNSGVAGIVASTNGAVGYVSASYLISQGIPAAALRNAARKFEYPNYNNIKAAAQTVHGVPGNNEIHIVNPGKGATIAYPMSTFTYVVVRHDASQKSLLKSFISFAITTGQKFGPALDFVRLPQLIVNADNATLNSL
jgi:phosphate transport system substrate-binding protein